MRTINTVRGPISKEDLGAVLAHEHFVFGYPGYSGDLSHDAFKGQVKQDYYDYCKNIFDHLKADHGLRTVVDPTPNDCGRNVPVLKEIAEYLDINIIVSTGYYSEMEGAPSYFKFRKTFGSDIVKEAHEMMQKEIYEGIEETGVKANLIKLASSLGEITAYEKDFFEAACLLAANDRDIRIYTHLSSGTAVKEQADFFKNHGVDPSQVCIGHICGNNDVDLQKELLKEGFFAGYDRIGLVGFAGCPEDSVRFNQILQLTEAGFEDRIMISTDRIGYNFGRQNDYVYTDAYKTMCKNQRWEYIFDDVLPELECLGLNPKQAQKLVAGNPAAFFG